MEEINLNSQFVGKLIYLFILTLILLLLYDQQVHGIMHDPHEGRIEATYTILRYWNSCPGQSLIFSQYYGFEYRMLFSDAN